MFYRFMETVENLLSKMYIAGTLMSKSRNIALICFPPLYGYKMFFIGLFFPPPSMLFLPRGTNMSL